MTRMNAGFQNNERWFAATLKSIGEAVIATNNAGAITFMNPVAEALTGWTQAAALGKNILFLPMDDDMPVDDLASSDIVIQLSSDPLLISRTGQAVPIEYTGSPIKDERGNVAGVVLVIQDITARKQAEYNLQQAKNAAEEAQRAAEEAQRAAEEAQRAAEEAQRAAEEAQYDAEAANRAKSRFLATMGHELRTPLNAILGYAQILQEARNLMPQQRQNAAIIQRSGQHLLTLVDDILDVSAFESGHLELHAHEFELAGLLRAIGDIAEMQVAQKDLKFRLDQQPDLPARLYADEQRLRQVLLNLLKNAVKFTERGEITFRVKAEGGNGVMEYRSDAEDSQHSTTPALHHSTTPFLLSFEIEDTGIGIPPEKLQEIFLPFQQIDGDYHAVDGAGLGLTICCRLLTLMGSTLQVESTPGKGSRFWFNLTLPLTTYAQGIISPPETPEPTDLTLCQAKLPQEYVDRLLHLAERGNPKKLLAELDLPDYAEVRQHPLIDQLRHYARNYQIEQCLDLLRKAS